MATNLISFQPIGIRAYAASGDSHRRNSSSSSSNWFTPLFGWSFDPDYIDAETDNARPYQVALSKSKQDLETKTSRSRFAFGCFTAEKAKQLRLMTTSSLMDMLREILWTTLRYNLVDILREILLDNPPNKTACSQAISCTHTQLTQCPVHMKC